mgnify:CR=1 FL=1
MLKIQNVTKKFGALTAVNDLSFEVAKGQVFGIAGPNGAGKSTLYNLITGFYKFDGIIGLRLSKMLDKNHDGRRQAD